MIPNIPGSFSYYFILIFECSYLGYVDFHWSRREENIGSKIGEFLGWIINNTVTTGFWRCHHNPLAPRKICPPHIYNFKLYSWVFNIPGMLGMQIEEILRIFQGILGSAVQCGGSCDLESLWKKLLFLGATVLTFTFLSFYILQSFPSNAKCFIPMEGQGPADGGIVP